MEQGNARGNEPGNDPRNDDTAVRAGEVVFVPSPQRLERRYQRWKWVLTAGVMLVAVTIVAVLIAWPRIKPRRLDAVEKVAETYLQALIKGDAEGERMVSTVEDPPAIRSVRAMAHDRIRDSRVRGSFAPLGELHARIEADYDYDARAGRFTPKNVMGIAAETLDALHAAKEEADADKVDIAKKIESGSPDDLFDAAIAMSKTYTNVANLASGVLAPKKIVPTYAMLVESARPPIKGEAKLLADEVGADTKLWQTLLGRPFFSLKADGPFSLEHAEVLADVMDKLASSGDPPSRLRLKMVRFRLEGIDTGWKIISARRILKDAPERVEIKAGESLSKGAASTPKSLSDRPTPEPAAEK
jgi:hypothetical protein